jgi:hypothetical protein
LNGQLKGAGRARKFGVGKKKRGEAREAELEVEEASH